MLADTESSVDSATCHGHIYCADPGKLSDFQDSIIAYIAGFVVHSLKLRLKCSECASALTVTSPPRQPSYSLIHRKTLGGISFPSKDVLEICRHCEKELRRALVCRAFQSKDFAD